MIIVILGETYTISFGNNYPEKQTCIMLDLKELIGLNDSLGK